MNAGAGHFITFEGGEGAGKTTQIAKLAEVLERNGQDVVRTREPGGSPAAEEIRGLLLHHETSWEPLSEALLHYAARCEHLRETIRPALARGAWVLCDRFSDSTLAYQGYALGLDRDAIETLERLVVAGTGPDLTIILDVSPNVGMARLGKRGGDKDRYERMDSDFHARLRDGFLQIARQSPARCVVVDAERDPEAVHKDVLTAVRDKLRTFPG
jgi:dTMP kinase